MKQNYIKPTIEYIYIEPAAIMVGSEKGRYDLGGPGSQWPESGPIKEVGSGSDGPLETGAKRHSLWAD